MIATELKKGEIIDIVTFDENCQKKVRRVKITRCRQEGGAFEIVGVNMKGEYPQEYVLEVDPSSSLAPVPGVTYWVPFDDSGEADE